MRREVRRQERDEEHSMSVEKKFGLATVGFVLGVVGCIAGMTLVKFLFWDFDIDMLEVRLVLAGGICSAVYFSFLD